MTRAPAGPVVRARVALALAAVMVVIFAYALFEMAGFNRDSQLLPALAILPGLALCLLLLLREGRTVLRQGGDAAATADGFAEPAYLVAFACYALAIWIVGFTAATGGFLIWVLFACARMKPVTGALYGFAVIVLAHGLLDLMKLTPPGGLVLRFITT